MVSTTHICGIDSIQKKKDGSYEVSYMLTGLPEEVCEEAKNIDGGMYADDCFGFKMTYNVFTKSYSLVEKDGSSVFYLDDDGCSHQMDYDIPPALFDVAKKRWRKKFREMKNSGLV